MIADFFEFLMNGVFDFFQGFFGLFPSMPFSAEDLSEMMGLNIVSQVLGWVNYFLPLDVASAILALWAAAMMAYIGLKLSIKYSEKIVK